MTEKKKILIVDDDPDCIEQVTMMLGGGEYELVTAFGQSEGEEALLRIQPDLAILDLMMEEMDSGFVLCHTVKKLYPEAKVVLLTGVTSATGISFKHADRPSGRSWFEADVLLDKPVRPEELRNAVARLLNP